MRVLGLIVFIFALPAAAAELPSRQAKPVEAPKARACQINGQAGWLASDGQTCVRLSGYVSGQIAAKPK